MKKKYKEYKDGTCFKTRNKKIKPKYQIKLELFEKYNSWDFKTCREYNEFLDSETKRIYNEQFN